MGLRACALALWCAAVVARAAAYTVDCNHEYTDCDTELSKLASEDDDLPSLSATQIAPIIVTTTKPEPLEETRPKIDTTTEAIEVTTQTTPATVKEFPDTKPKGRLLNLNVDDLQNFANALHNQTNQKNHSKSLTDLSDVNLDDDDEEPPRMPMHDKHDHNKQISDKFYSNLQVPFNPLISMTASEEMDTCKENGITYKIGERLDRGCEETCECAPGGGFDCTPRCKHPYIRRGRRLTDPLCFESPVDECCSIIACATGNGEVKPTKVEVCRYGNDTFPVGAKWFVGCEQRCTCDPNSVVTCKPRCNPLPQSDKCINVQDPNDACCEVQICDVSQDVHEEPIENVTTSTTTSTTTETVKGFEDYSDIFKSTMRPLVLTEPIGSIKVLQNNSVQVNLMHTNSSEDPIHLLLSDDGGKNFEDVALKYSNLILNLPGGKDYILKTKETGTKFNFTITSFDQTAEDDAANNTDKVGCQRDGKFYAVGEEFHIGCTELCECTGPDTQECVALVCPSHVGLELVSKGCVRWAPSPPPQPPNCCPRAARCLSDGTCHYKGNAVPNWSEVPISLTGCELRCFCENGELDCQEVCTPLPTTPPQTLRCPPAHHPAPVNISDDDCCKQWGCIPSAEDVMESTLQTYVPTYDDPSVVNYVTPVPSMSPTTTETTPPPLSPDPNEFFKHLHPVKSYPKVIKTITHLTEPETLHSQEHVQGDNITVFTLDDMEFPFKIIHPDHSLTSHTENWQMPLKNKDTPKSTDFKIVPSNPSLTNYGENWQPIATKLLDPFHSFTALPRKPPKPPNFIISHDDMHELIDPKNNKAMQMNFLNEHEVTTKRNQDVPKRVPMSKVENLNFFLPTHKSNTKHPEQYRTQYRNDPFNLNNEPLKLAIEPPKGTQKYFSPTLQNSSMNYIPPKVPQNSLSYSNQPRNYKTPDIERYGNHLMTFKRTKPTTSLLSGESKPHLLIKAPNPYETVLLRPVPAGLSSLPRNMKVPQVHSPLDLEHLVRQMEVESEVNRNLERSADKTRNGAAAGKTPPPDLPANLPRPHPPPFLPTIPPEIHFPQDELPDYGNNLHRPVNSLEPNLPGLPPGLAIQPSYGDDNKKLSVISLVADSPTSVKLLFGLPPVLVGLRGSVDLRYTDKGDEDISHWFSQVFAPADEVLTTPRLEFRLTGLKPSTAYKIRGKLYLHNLPVEPESEIYSVRTLDLPTVVPMEEKRREIDSRLTVVDVNDTVAHISWRHFTEDELNFIDGIQIRYRPVGTPIYSMTELLHHSRSLAELHDLRPGSRYEASLVLVPPPRASTELHDPGKVEFTTSPYIDPYNWTVTIEARVVGSEAAELTWRGVPSPAERWVRIYRAAHACGDTRREHDAFRLAARDLPPTILMTGLESDTRCRVWLELFLTNGKIKTSNVLEILTKSLDTPSDIDNEIEASSIAGSRGSPRGDYYGALVVVGVVAALGALTSLLLLLVLVRRHRPRSVPITTVPSAPRESSLPPYDNPAYKLELQQETMDL